MPQSLLASVRAELTLVAEPNRAPAMQAYMKSEMPFHGVTSPLRRALSKRFFAEHPVKTASAWQKDVLSLWRPARYREERYVAIDLAGDKRAHGYRTLAALPMFEEMIVSGAWWDYVDEIAGHYLGDILRAAPAGMKRSMRAWSRSSDMWKRRSAIICQLTFKADTDLPFLYEVIEPALESREFFLRKAIGWALRQHAWTAPNEVIRYVRERKADLSPLSKREALKNVLKAGLIKEVP